MFSLSRRTFQHNIVYAWDREGQSNIVEIAKKEVDKTYLKGLDIDIFLSKFEAWKNANSEERQSLFASLRDMHQAAGINKASTVFGADEEMLAFGDYVAQVKKLQQKTRVAILGVEPVGRSDDPQIKDGESLVSGESLVPVVPIVAPKKRRIRIKQRVKHDGNHKNLSHSPKPESGPEKNIDFSKENKLIKGIIENVKKPSYVSKFNDNEKQFSGTSVVDIDYAVVKQKDPEFYIYDKPVNDERTVYRTDMNKNVIGVVTVDKDNNISNPRGKSFKTPFRPAS